MSRRICTSAVLFGWRPGGRSGGALVAAGWRLCPDRVPLRSSGRLVDVTGFPEGPEASPGFLLWHLTLAWQRSITAVLAPLDLTHVQFVLLTCAWWCGQQGQAPNQLQLARQAGIDVKMTSQVLRRLEVKGLVGRKVDSADTRARRVRLTASGLALAQQAVVAVEQADGHFFDEEADVMLPALRRLALRAAGDAGSST